MADEQRELRKLISEINKKLTRLEDVEAIQRLIATYARGCDRGNDPEIIAPLFTDEATWECKGFGIFTGGPMIGKALNAIAGKKIWWSLHYMISPMVDINEDGQSGTAAWYLWEPATVPNPISDDAEPHWVGATYDTDVVKRDGTWYFNRLELNLNMLSPFGEGWVESKFPQGSRTAPYLMNLDAGAYHWCSCGRSKNQPFCDGSHKDTRRTPVEFKLEDHTHVALCGCKYSKTKPYCDGSHLQLKLEE